MLSTCLGFDSQISQNRCDSKKGYISNQALTLFKAAHSDPPPLKSILSQKKQPEIKASLEKFGSTFPKG